MLVYQGLKKKNLRLWKGKSVLKFGIDFGLGFHVVEGIGLCVCDRVTGVMNKIEISNIGKRR